MESCKDVKELDVFQGPASQDLGEEREEGMVYHVTLRRIRYGGQSLDDSPASHLVWISEKVRTIRAGILEKLVEGLAPDPRVMEFSHVYRTCFLSTYRCFSDTGKIMGLLVSRYLSLVEKATDSYEEGTNKRSIKGEILSYLNLWLDTYPQDFPCPLSNPHLVSLCPLAQQSDNLSKVIMAMRTDSREASSNGRNGHNGVALSEGGKDNHDIKNAYTLFSIFPEEFAHALTSEDARLFLGVSPPECLEYVRCPKDTTNAPTVRACIDHFNTVSLVVVETILKGLTPDHRSLIIKRWLNIARYCRGVKNFSSLKAIVSGLESAPVFRLQRSWELLSHSKLQLFHELSELLSADDNYQISRELLNREGTAKYAEVQTKRGWGWKVDKQQSPVGVVPYLGTFLTDLTMLHTAHHDNTEDGLINFEKFRKLFNILVQLTLFQKSAANYGFQANIHLLHWLQSTHTASPSDSHALSKELEPDTPTGNSTSNYNMLKLVQPKILISASSALVHRSLINMFGIKGSTVGYLLPTSLGHTSNTLTSNTLTSSASENDLTRIDYKSRSEHRLSISQSPILRRISMPVKFTPVTGEGVGHIVRVAVENDINCLYKCLMVEQSDKCHTIIQQSMEKHGLPGSHKQFKLFQVKRDKNQHIPRNANVYYALDTSDKALPVTLLLSPNT